jgi:hypothetical protein
MSYLARLKAEFSGKTLPNELTKPTKPPSGSFVSAPSRHVSDIEADREAFEERAAIMEFDGGLTRAEAERLARLDVSARYRRTIH